MERLEQVSVVRRANVYFDGRVTSRTVFLPDGSRVTLGVILPGEYAFGTGVAERMELLAGWLEVQLPGQIDWQRFGEGQTFDVPAHSTFRVRTDVVADYCCAYL